MSVSRRVGLVERAAEAIHPTTCGNDPNHAHWRGTPLCIEAALAVVFLYDEGRKDGYEQHREAIEAAAFDRRKAQAEERDRLRGQIEALPIMDGYVRRERLLALLGDDDDTEAA